MLIKLLITIPINDIVKKNINDIPPANPSKPSIKLIEFIKDTINKIVKGYENKPKLIYKLNTYISFNNIFP